MKFHMPSTSKLSKHQMELEFIFEKTSTHRTVILKQSSGVLQTSKWARRWLNNNNNNKNQAIKWAKTTENQDSYFDSPNNWFSLKNQCSHRHEKPGNMWQCCCNLLKQKLLKKYINKNEIKYKYWIKNMLKILKVFIKVWNNLNWNK